MLIPCIYTTFVFHLSQWEMIFLGTKKYISFLNVINAHFQSLPSLSLFFHLLAEIFTALPKSMFFELLPTNMIIKHMEKLFLHFSYCWPEETELPSESNVCVAFHCEGLLKSSKMMLRTNVMVWWWTNKTQSISAISICESILFHLQRQNGSRKNYTGDKGVRFCFFLE